MMQTNVLISVIEKILLEPGGEIATLVERLRSEREQLNPILLTELAKMVQESEEKHVSKDEQAALLLLLSKGSSYSGTGRCTKGTRVTVLDDLAYGANSGQKIK